MRTAVVYCYPTVDPAKYVPAAKKFVSSYLQFPGSLEEPELHVVVNSDGTLLHPMIRELFDQLSPHWHYHDNRAKDLGAFMMAAKFMVEAKFDLMVCCGAHVNFWKPGWLDVITRSYSTLGPAVYGAWGFQEPLPHLRTTFFWCPPQILASYPWLKSESDRYGMEHGPENIALWSRKQGFEPFQITWTGAYSMKHWHALTLEEGLVLDQHTKKHHGK